MASYSLQTQPVTIRSTAKTKVLSFQSTKRNTTTTPVVSSALFRRDEAARLCFAARRSTLGSQIWSKESRRGLANWIRLLPVSRPGSHLLVSASEEAKEAIHHALEEMEKQWPKQLGPGTVCAELCECCSRYESVIPLPKSFDQLLQEDQMNSSSSTP